MKVSTVGIVGVGLLGGSLIKDIVRWKDTEVIGFCRSDDSAKSVRRLKLGCRIESLNTAAGRSFLQKCDLVVLAMPVNAIKHFLANDASSLINANAVITDVGSTKKTICDIAKKNKAIRSRFVGAHPMAGSEKQGSRYAETDLFKNQTCFVMKSTAIKPELMREVKFFWKRLGSQVEVIEIAEHDRVVAKISHMPHIASTTLIQSLMASNPNYMRYGRSGLASVHRAAGSNPVMWSQILLENKKHILKELDCFITKMNMLRSRLASASDPEKLNRLLDTSDYDKAYRKHIARYEKTSRRD